jgi:diguanylate cyclase (GGDEF)-like protein
LGIRETVLLQVILAFSGICLVGWVLVGNALKLAPASSKILGLANLLLGSGIYFLMESSSTPSAIYDFTSDFCLLISVWLFRTGSVILMKGERQKSFWFAVPISSATIVLAYLYAIKNENAIRVVVFSIAAAWEMGYCFWESYKILRKEEFKRYAELTISGPILVTAGLLLARGVFVFFTASGDMQIPKGGEEQFVGFLWSIVIMIVILNMSIAGLSATRLIVQIKSMSEKDHLTGAFNRQAIEKKFLIEVERFNRSKEPMACVFMDIDHFKSVNDTHGHDAGDEAIRHMVRTVMHTIRPTDSLGRYGGEEFVIAMPNTDINGARDAANRIKHSLETTSFEYKGKTIAVTASLGAAIYRIGENPAALISRADEAMYRAKKNGRNRIELEAS